MRYKGWNSFLMVLFSLFSLSMPARAHHSSASEFDVLKEISLTGTITKMDWINPHAYLYVDVKDSDGKVSNWGFEMDPPRVMREYGLKREMFVVGQTIDVTLNPYKGGTKNLGWIRHIKFQNGDEINIRNHYVVDDSK